MIETIKKWICNHSFELINEWIGIYTSDFRSMDDYMIRTYFCKKCGKVKKIHN